MSNRPKMQLKKSTSPSRSSLFRLGEAQAVLVVLIDRVADAHRIIASDLPADLLVDHSQDAHPVF